MNLLECIMYNSTCYKQTTKGRPVGILWHDTGAGNPNLWRYVQPTDKNPNKDEILRLLGKNVYGTDWNHTTRLAGVHFFIGKLANGEIGTVKVLPLDYRPWGCGIGKYGSCNGSPSVKNSPFWIQFEICDDGYGSRSYFEKCYREAVELTAWLCKTYGFDPMAKTKYNGVTLPVLTCHYEASQYGLAEAHSDVLVWTKKYGKNMDDIRRDVKDEMEGIDMTREQLDAYVDEKISAALSRQAQTYDKVIDELRESFEKALETAKSNGKEFTDQTVEKFGNTNLGPYVTHISDIPHVSVQKEVRPMLDTEVINGGTDYERDPDDIRLPYNLVRTLVMAKRYTDLRVREMLEDVGPEDE